MYFTMPENQKYFRNLRSNYKSESIPGSVLLITPPSVFLLDERVFVSLGILKVAAVLEEFQIKVEHLDLSGITNFEEVVKYQLETSSTNIVGITVTTPQLPIVVKIIDVIRKTRKGVRIILGGPHITLTYAAVKLERKKGIASRAHQSLNKLMELADVLVCGDGELAILKAIGPYPDKIIDADDMNNSLFLTNEIYDQSPYPSRHLVDLTSYNYEIEGHKSTSLIAQLGCPFCCGFCGGRNSKSLRNIRIRSVESIINELTLLNKIYGYTGFMFYDDELNVNKNMIPLMKELINLQEKLGVDFRLRGFVKSQLFTQEQADLMYSAGFRWLLSGFESGSERILSNMNKKATLDDNFRAVEYAKNAGLKVKALMSLGHPGESPETIIQTQDWLLKIHPDDFDCTIITTYPGTPYYDEAVKNEKIDNVWTFTNEKNNDRLHSYELDYFETADYYKGDPNDGYKSYVFTDYISAEEIVRMRNWIENSVRGFFKIPFPKAGVSKKFEHSMGQGVNHTFPNMVYNQTYFEY